MFFFRPRPYTLLFWRFVRTCKENFFSSWNSNRFKECLVKVYRFFHIDVYGILPWVGVLTRLDEFSLDFFIIRWTDDFDASMCGAISRQLKCVPGLLSCEQARSWHSSSFACVETVTGLPLPGFRFPEPVSLILFTKFVTAVFETSNDGCSFQILYALHPSSRWFSQLTAYWWEMMWLAKRTMSIVLNM